MKWLSNSEICLSKIQGNSFIEIIQSENPSLALIKSQNAALSLKILTDLINGFLDTLNIGKSMDGRQVLECAKMMLEDYSVLKPDDFVLFFNKAKRGYYGKAYDRMDSHVIFEWLEQYMYDRTSEFEQHRRNEHIKREKELNTDVSVGFPEYFKPLLEKKVKETEIKPLIQTDEQKQINTWIKEFDELWELQGSATGKRFVLIGENYMDVGEWLLWKQKNESDGKLDDRRG